MTTAILRFSGILIRKNFALLISLIGHALVIWIALVAWRAFIGYFSQPQGSVETGVFEIELISPEELNQQAGEADIAEGQGFKLKMDREMLPDSANQHK